MLTSRSCYRLVTVLSSEFQHQVVRPDGLPDVALTLFGHELQHSLSSQSVPRYLRAIVGLLNWSLYDPVVTRNGWRLLGSPSEVRNLVREYLTSGAECRVTIRQDTNRLTVNYVRETAGTSISLGTLLAALKRLFETLISKSMYLDRNPFIHEDAGKVRAEIRRRFRDSFRQIEGRNPMPTVSGVDPPSHLRLSENYFRRLEKQWIPQTVDDPDFPNIVYNAGKQYGWKLRELCIARILHESGARISEICGLTALDWSKSHFRNELTAPNKGSHGERTKILKVSQPTAKLLRKYFDDKTHGRRAHDNRKLTLGDLANLLVRDRNQLVSIPLFLTERGTPMTARLFRDQYWRPALRSAGFDADPHQARHWFVTNALRNIELTSKSDGELLRHKEELIEYMAWRSGEQTMAAYEHIQRHDQFLERLADIHGVMKTRERRFKANPQRVLKRTLTSDTACAAKNEELAALTGEYGDD